MRITRIQIERFKGLRKVDLSFHGPLSLIAGRNNAGKTTILQALDFFFSSHSKWELENFQPKNSYYQKEGSRPLIKVKLHFGDLISSEEEIFESAYSSRTGSFWVEVRCGRGGSFTYSASKNADGNAIYESLCEQVQVVHVPSVRVEKEGYEDSEIHRLISTVDEVLVKRRPGRSSSLQKKFEKGSDKLLDMVQAVLDHSKEAAQDILPGDSDLTFSMPSSGDLLLSVLSNVSICTRGGMSVPLRDEGTGFQSLLAMGLLSHAIKKHSPRNGMLLFLIEEPEAFLHPQYQRLLARHLLSLSKKSQVIVTTHSGSVIDEADIESIVRLPRNPEGLELTWRPLKLPSDVAGRLSRWCDAKNSEVVFGDGVIFVEGISDKGSLQALLEMNSEIDLLSNNISIIDIQGADKAVHFLELAKRFRVPYLLVLDRDCYSGSNKKLADICKKSGQPFSSHELNKIDQADRTKWKDLKTAWSLRDQVNEVCQKRSIFCLSSDIEGAVVTSYSKRNILNALSRDSLKVLSKSEVDTLNQLSGTKLHQALFTAVGSKGWQGSKKTNNDKIKQHIPPQIIRSCPAKFSSSSDLKNLLQRVSETFIGGIEEI